jgi:hypothetical protein
MNAIFIDGGDSPIIVILLTIEDRFPKLEAEGSNPFSRFHVFNWLAGDNSLR